ncbi:hypothetical protein ACT4S5_17755 [Kocuria oceani]|uniref:hypothetical protein n=1 Tax=Kocuria oceani TaxID=988827 RepID=UPI004036585C
MNSTGNSDGSGVALLVTGATVVSVVSSVLADLRVIAVTALVLAGLLVVVLLLRTTLRALRPGAAGRRRARHRTLETARRAGAEDMRAAWMHRQLGLLPPQQRSADTAFVAARLAEVPRADWDVARLRLHGRALWSVRDAAGRTPLHQEVEARLDRVAAVISDLTEDEFDTHLGQRDDRYLLHPDPDVRAAYLAGGSEAVEAIMGAISAARAQARADAAAQAAADSLARERNAALRALREIHRPTGSRDAHAAWEEQARRIGR